MSRTKSTFNSVRKDVFRRATIAMVYDFDGTLTPQPMQEYTVLPKVGMEPREFWRRVNEEAHRTSSDTMLTYLRLLIESIEDKKLHLAREDLTALARNIRYYPGVTGWFQGINRYVREQGGGRVKVKHYIISAGLKEILDGISIRDEFDRIYASEYFFDHHQVARFPKVVINDTAKTQYLFRINKGRLDLRESINDSMPEADRPVPFSNMVFIGDGESDIPCMTLTQKSGGHAIAVHRPGPASGQALCRRLYSAGRIDGFAPADYRPGRPLERHIRLILDVIIARIHHERARWDFERKLMGVEKRTTT